TRPTWTRAWPASRRARTSRVTCSERAEFRSHAGTGRNRGGALPAQNPAMRRFPPALLVAALAACTTMIPDPAGMAASLAAAETAFAAQSVREGLRAAFLAW